MSDENNTPETEEDFDLGDPGDDGDFSDAGDELVVVTEAATEPEPETTATEPEPEAAPAVTVPVTDPAEAEPEQTWKLHGGQQVTLADLNANPELVSKIVSSANQMPHNQDLAQKAAATAAEAQAQLEQAQHQMALMQQQAAAQQAAYHQQLAAQQQAVAQQQQAAAQQPAVSAEGLTGHYGEEIKNLVDSGWVPQSIIDDGGAPVVAAYLHRQNEQAFVNNRLAENVVALQAELAQIRASAAQQYLGNTREELVKKGGPFESLKDDGVWNGFMEAIPRNFGNPQLDTQSLEAMFLATQAENMKAAAAAQAQALEAMRQRHIALGAADPVSAAATHAKQAETYADVSVEGPGEGMVT
jgi:hypothetical protein